MAELIALDHDAVLAAGVAGGGHRAYPRRLPGPPSRDWTMPPKVYLDSPGFGDFRAMPARGGDLAMLKWISSFPATPRSGCRP
jgi:hypothetical protein